MQYKHKHTGQVVTKGTDGLYHSQEGGYTLQRWIFENSNDWEEVKEESKKPFFNPTPMPNQADKIKPKEEPNYLITAFRFKSDGHICKINSKGRYEFITDFSLKEMLSGEYSVEDGTFEIYSVKNSKGEEFTIGELAYFQTHLHIIYKTSKILSFTIIEGDIILAITEDREGNIELLHKSEKKQPIYTTSDGVDIFEGEGKWLWLLSKDLLTKKLECIFCFSKQDKEVASRYLTFTSEENRDKYIKENSKKPIFDNLKIEIKKDGTWIYL